MKHLLLSLLLFTLAGCQIDGLDPLNAKTVVPDVNARISRKLSVSVDGKTVYSEEKYEYNSEGKLARVDRFNRNSNGQLTLSSYQTYGYNTDGTLLRRLDFYRSSNTSGFQALYVRDYRHPAVNQSVEIAFSVNYTSNVWTLMSRTETSTENGLPAKVSRYYPNSSQQLILQNTSTYTYKAGRLIAEEFRDAAGKPYNTQHYIYKGRTATVESVVPNSSQSYPVQVLNYDRRARLIRQQYAGRSDYGWSSSYRSSYSIPAITVFEYDN